MTTMTLDPIAVMEQSVDPDRYADFVERSEYGIALYSDFWCDEFPVKGFLIGKLAEIRSLIFPSEEQFPVTWWYGTNEAFTYSTAEEYANCWEIRPITRTEAATFARVLTVRSFPLYYGLCPIVEELLSDYGDDEKSL